MSDTILFNCLSCVSCAACAPCVALREDTGEASMLTAHSCKIRDMETNTANIPIPRYISSQTADCDRQETADASSIRYRIGVLDRYPRKMTGDRVHVTRDQLQFPRERNKRRE